ncbi:MAG: hemolysin family protein [Chloroflexota bacterium]
MDEISISNGVVALVLLLLDALVTLAYVALANADLPEDRTDRRGRRTADRRRQFALTGQVALVFIRFAMVTLVITGIALPLAQSNPTVPAWVIVTAVLLPLALIVLILGELFPTSMGMAQANQIAASAQAPMGLLMAVLSPFLWLVSRTTSVMLRAVGVSDQPQSITEQQLLKMVESNDELEAEERKMIHSIIQLDETTVTEMMVPRIDITAVEKATSIKDARQFFLDSGHSRMPVYDGNIDHVVGLVYVKDLLEVWHNGHTTVQSVAEIMRPANFVPEAMTGDQLLAYFQRNKVHLAIVMEEYGGTGGLVTLEDLLEEIVGDIQDEYDEDEFDEIIPMTEDTYRVDAGVSLYVLNERLDTNLEEEEVDTLGGFIFKTLDRVPDEGEIIPTEDLELTVISVEGRRIRDVNVRVLAPPDDNEDSEDTDNEDEKPKNVPDSEPAEEES